MRKDEQTARIEKEKMDDRAKAAEREHRLNILRSRANITTENSAKIVNKANDGVDLFPNDNETINNDSNKKKYEDLPSKIKSKPKSSDDVIADHVRNDPTLQISKQIKGKSSNSKDYSFV